MGGSHDLHHCVPSRSEADLLHDNVKKYGTVFTTVAPGTDLQGALVRAT
jgi:hypothetical protein